MKLKIKPCDNHDNIVVFDKVKDLAELWRDISWIPDVLVDAIYLPDVFVIDVDDDFDPKRIEVGNECNVPQLYIGDSVVVYRTQSGKGVYIFEPHMFTFRGYRGSFTDGCPFTDWTPFYNPSGDLTIVTVEVKSPLGVGVYFCFGAGDFNIEVETSTPWRRLDTTRD